MAWCLPYYPYKPYFLSFNLVTMPQLKQHWRQHLSILLKNNIRDVKPKDIKLTGFRKAGGDTGHTRSFGKEEIKKNYTKFSIDVPETEQEITAQHFKIALINISYDYTLYYLIEKTY